MLSSSSSLPSPSLSIQRAPFNQPPFELVEEILKLTVPSYYHSRTYEERQDTLLSLCLVSRLFHQIARPLLHAVAVFYLPEDLQRWPQQREEEAGTPLGREMILFPMYPASDDRTEVDLQPLVQSQLFLSTLALLDIETVVDLVELSRLHQLSSLRLSRLTISASLPIVLPRLTDLTLTEVVPEEFCLSNLRQKSFPSLRAFASFEVYRSTPPTPIVELFATELFLQLDVIQLDEPSISHLSSEFLDSIKHKTLFEYKSIFLDSEARRYKTPKYFRFGSGCDTSDALDYFYGEIYDWAGPSIPSLIYLSPTWEFDDRYQTQREDQRDDCRALSGLCRRQRIKVIYEEHGNDGEDPDISQDFWERMRRAKLEETRGEKEE
ncbi:hypothetical protein JCM5350_005984 [Sporobolomyces pararoseus]